MLINPINNVATGNVANEQEQTIGGLVEAAVPQAMPGQGALVEVIRLGACLKSLVVLAACEPPIPLQLMAAGLLPKRSFNLRPRYVAVAINVPVSDCIRDPLKAEDPHQPVENLGCIVGLDGANQTCVVCIMTQIVDTRHVTGNLADLPNKRLGVPHSLSRPLTRRLLCHVRLTPPIAAGRRYRRQCTAGLFE